MGLDICLSINQRSEMQVALCFTHFELQTLKIGEFKLYSWEVTRYAFKPICDDHWTDSNIAVQCVEEVHLKDDVDFKRM